MNNPSIFALLKGIGLALVAIWISIQLPRDLFIPFYAMLLAFAAGVYVGFAIVDKKHIQEFYKQICFSVVIMVFAFLGMLEYPILIPLAWIMHGIWDGLHHLRKFKTETGETYPLFCMSFDFVVGLYLLYYLMF